ncbi:hypothetical protein Kpol_1055p10 [Vanderwaltozyma polyspora DSM 70294]|uniref:Uncharacterized protein n=1 Tax=Vanderwaltozyma polyspora (strain ATCC 22028 / DSM 70294 / BCRC 21397 / CBS 2163 / NBRC 10782 / NRRL Y-8283 / UCD 57-17) TaxID=436907 RepID=A7TG84_VANPO|nr:uncharacterized protein Kpol_1055p10 [Vanderwaltozyma polyspora DSM 70294]EDO18654.1 hypothetical protein Kpol_1055p10 [Vanderwaltozyma polyspora DSM 70294]
MRVNNIGGRTESVMRLDHNGHNQQRASPEQVEESLKLIDDLKFFLATAPVNWQENQVIRRYYLNNDQGFTSCIFWNNLFYITGTDIVKCCMYRMQKFGREVIQKKKFEEGIFSDLRHLKCGIDATLEQPKSEFLSFLFRNMCLKTQKKQKVFFWFSVPHDKLFADALERDLKRESLGQPSTTKPINDPAASFQYNSDSEYSLYDQLSLHVNSKRTNKEVYKQVQFSPDDDSAGTPLNNQTDIMREDAGSTSVQTSYDENDNAKIDQSPMQSQDVNEDQDNKFSQQTLVLDSNSLDINTDSASFEAKQHDSINKLVEEDDFPLDYVPIEIEYPNQEEAIDGFSMQPNDMFQPSSMLYENSMVFPEDDLMPTTATMGKFNYPMAAPMGWPVSATRPHFMMNSEYYASNGKNLPDSPNPSRKNASVKKQTNIDLVKKSSNENNENVESQEDDENVSQNGDVPQYPMYPNPYQYPYQYNNSMVPPNGFPPNMYNGYQMEPFPQPVDASTYPYDDFFPSHEGFDEGYFLQSEPFSWGYVPPQGMQLTAPPYMSKVYSQQGFKQNQIPPRNSYQSSQGPSWNGQTGQTGYHSRSNSKNYQNTPMRSQGAQAQGERWRHFHRNSQSATATKFYFSKAGKVNKQGARKVPNQQRQYMMKQNLKMKPDMVNSMGSGSSSGNTDINKNTLPVLTPESTNLISQSELTTDKTDLNSE